MMFNGGNDTLSKEYSELQGSAVLPPTEQETTGTVADGLPEDTCQVVHMLSDESRSKLLKMNSGTLDLELDMATNYSTFLDVH